MDNSSQNDPGIHQPETENISGYQQYLDPGKKPNKQRKIIILAGLGLGVLMIIAAVIIFAQPPDQNKQKAQPLPDVVTCTDKDCFETNFQQCTPAEYTYNAADISSVKYKIQGFGEIGCSVEMEYITSKYTPEAQGKKMICDFDNTVDLASAVQYVMDYPDDYDCQGELSDVFRNREEVIIPS